MTAAALTAYSVTSHAQPSATTELPAVTITTTPNPHKVERSGSNKYIQPLLDTPQTVTVVPETILEEQNAHSLREALNNVSGVTFTAGEGGGGSGDRLTIRGFDATANIQIDGLRSSAQSNRSDMFNTEVVEVIKGPNSVFGGAGTTGGSVNLISKRPKHEDFVHIDAGAGTAKYKRLTLDANQTFSNESGAWRLNFMTHANDVAGRKPVDKQRWGIAPSLRLGNETTQWTLSAFYQTDHNLPDYGVPAFAGKPLAGVSRHAYFGFSNLDREEQVAYSASSDLQHRLASGATLQNLTRYSNLNRDTVISASQVRLNRLPPGRYLPAGPQGFGTDATTALVANQTNLIAEFDLGSMKHQMIIGLELAHETYQRHRYTYGISQYFPKEGYPLSAPPGVWNGPVQEASSSRDKATLVTKALYAMDSISLNQRWDVNLGLRHDWIDARLHTQPTQGESSRLASNDSFLSGRAALTFKPTAVIRTYLAYGNSFNPSSELLVTTGRGLSAQTRDLAPERSDTWELGAKWDTFDARLALNAALFQVTKHKARERLVDGSTILSGQQQTRGLELGAAGQLTRDWGLYVTYTFLNGKTTKSASQPTSIGRPLGNTPKHSFNVWTTYDWGYGWKTGYGLRFIGQRAVSSIDTGELPSHVVHNLMISYAMSRHFSLQLNIDNLTNTSYIQGVRQSAGTTSRSSAVEFGASRSAMLTATWRY